MNKSGNNLQLGLSPSGKAQDFDSCIRGSESRQPCRLLIGDKKMSIEISGILCGIFIGIIIDELVQILLKN